MSGQQQQHRRSPVQTRLYLAGIVILVAGLVGGAILYLTAPAQDSAEAIYGVANDPRYVAELQRIGGNAEVALAGFHRWLDGLWHGKPLAYTVAVLCAVVAAICFWLGHIGLFEPLHEQPGEQDEPDR
jgi:hypothetical protein